MADIWKNTENFSILLKELYWIISVNDKRQNHLCVIGQFRAGEKQA